MQPAPPKPKKARKTEEKALSRSRKRSARAKIGHNSAKRGPFAFVRVHPIRSLAGLGKIERHAKRLDNKFRHDPARTHLNVAACAYNADDPCGVVGSFKSFKKQTGAVEGQGAIALHLVVGISPEVVAAHGDPHDPENPKNVEFLEEAKRWAASVFGEGATIHSRLDVDEDGSGVVDLVVCPTETQKGGRGRKEKLTISTRAALMNYQRALVDAGTGYVAQQSSKRSYSALQDGWALHARALHPEITRGVPKEVTGAKHVTADVFKRLALEEKRRLAVAQERLDATVIATAGARAEAESARAEAAAALAAARADRAAAQRDQDAAAEARRGSTRDRLAASMARQEADQTREIAAQERASAWAEIEGARRDVEKDWASIETREASARKLSEEADKKSAAVEAALENLNKRQAVLDRAEAAQREREIHREADQKIVIESIAYDELYYDEQREVLDFSEATKPEDRAPVENSLKRQGGWLQMVAVAFSKTWSALRRFTSTLSEDAETALISEARNNLGM